MARKFIFKNENIIKVSKAYLNDVLCIHNIESDEVYKITGDELKHVQILRHDIGENIVVNNMECKIIYMAKDFAIINKLKDIAENGKPGINITLYPAFLKSDKMDYLVQKSVELGVTTVAPFFSKNTIVKLDDSGRLKRKDKLQKISEEATKQCGRTDEVNIDEFTDFNDMLSIIPKHDFCIFAYENEILGIKSVINNLKEKNILYNDIAIIVGPEGGFDIKEMEMLKKISNVYTVSLGQRILRAETASINLITILMYEFDNK